MYSPMQEEYKLLNDEYVLPEFLVQYRFKGRAMGGDGRVGGEGSSAEERNQQAKDIFNIDLSTPVIEGCKFDRKKEKRTCKQIDAFPVTRSIATTRSGARPSVEAGEGRGAAQDGSGGGDNNTIAWASHDEWQRQRQNAALQKENVIFQVKDLVDKSTKLARDLSTKSIF